MMLISENEETNTLGCKEVENQSPDTPMEQLDTNELRNQVGFIGILWLLIQIYEFWDVQKGGYVWQKQ